MMMIIEDVVIDIDDVKDTIERKVIQNIEASLHQGRENTVILLVILRDQTIMMERERNIVVAVDEDVTRRRNVVGDSNFVLDGAIDNFAIFKC
jgi:transcriptional regulator CtsR